MTNPNHETAVCGLVVGLLAVVFTSCSSAPPNVHYSTSANSNVVNGDIYEDAAILVPKEITCIVVPQNASIMESESVARLVIHMTKSLAYMGQSDRRIHVDDLRTTMGCAYKIKGAELHLATFGEWDSLGAGGARMKIEITIPSGTVVRRGSDHAGPKSILNDPVTRSSWNSLPTTTAKED